MFQEYSHKFLFKKKIFPKICNLKSLMFVAGGLKIPAIAAAVIV